MTITLAEPATTDHPHSYTGYRNHGCRCVTCVTAFREWSRGYKKDLILGRARQVDAEVVRDHAARVIEALGITPYALGTLAGVSGETVKRLFGLNGATSKRVKVDVARKILAVPINATPTSGSLDPTGTQRRIQALACMGWGVADLDRRAGFKRGNLSTVLRRPEFVTVRTADTVRRLYDELSMTPGPSTKARRWAEREGFAPPLAWDDDTIDDPTARPAVCARHVAGTVDEVAVQRAAGGDRSVKLNPTERREAVRILHGYGMNDPQIAARLGTTTETVLRARQKLNLPANAGATKDALEVAS